MPSSRRRALTRLAVVVALFAGSFGFAAPAFADPSVPDAPTGVRAVPFISGTLAVLLDTPPADHGDPITSYTVDCESNDIGAPPGAGTDNVHNIGVSGLLDGASYTCTMLATNGQGDSAPSAPSDPVVVGTPGIWEPPVAVPGDGVIYVYPSDVIHGGADQGLAAACESSDGGGFSAHALHDGSTMIPVENLTNDKHYTCRLQGINGVGYGPFSPPSDEIVPSHTGITPGPPDARSLVLTPMDGALSVDFTPPDAGDDPPSNYEVRCDSDDGGVTGSNQEPGVPIVVTGLDNGKRYSCVARAMNTTGWGPWSQPMQADTVPGAAPDAPDSVTTVVVGNSAHVSFNAPANDHGYAITDYTATCTSSNGGVTRAASGGGSPVNVFAMSGQKTYTCAVTATNEIGTSDPSDPSAPFDTDDAPPDPPAKPTVTAHLGHLLIDSAPPWDGGDPISHYYATCTSSDGGNTVNTDDATFPLDVLADIGHTYTCSVSAENNVGSGNTSVASDSIVSATVPAAPNKPDVSASGTTITVEWDPPVDNGSAITGYTVTCIPQHGGAVLTDDFASSPAELANATNADTYNCAVVAENDQGVGSPSVSSDDLTIQAGGPDAPDSVDARPGDGSVIVAIDPGDDNGAVITGFDVDCVSSDGGTPGSASGVTSPLTVNGLDNGKTYVCTATNSNAGGASAGTAADPVIVGTPSFDGTTGAIGDDGSIVVVFIGDAHENAGPILSWTATCTSSDGGAPGTTTGNFRILRVTGLTNGKTYTCNMFATNEAGVSPATPDSDPVAPGTYPPPPTDIVGTRGNAEISLSFTPPADDLGDPITGYFAICISTDGGTVGQAVNSGSPVVVTALDNGHEYYCLIVAAHTVSFSSVSEYVGPITPGAVSEPDPPINVVATAGSESASVAFDPPADNGGDAITGYTATCVSSDGGVTGSVSGASSPLNVTELSGGKTYTCTVVATNSHGDSDDSDESNAIVVLAGSFAPANTHRPTISGTAMAQRKLTAHRGTWTGVPAPSYSYQWMRCDAQGNHCKGISHATKRTYRLKVADTDHKIRVAVIAVNAAGLSYRLSKPTRIVQWIPMSISGPYFYNGTAVHEGGVFSVGAASHGNSVWTTYPNGYVLGPRFGPGDGTLVRTTLKKPIVSIVATPTGKGYWMFAGDGGIFTFGDARFYGSTGAKNLFAPIVSMAVTPNGKGYWLFAADGGVFTFGNARFYGSTGGQVLAHPVVAMLSSPSGHGYWLVTSDGRALRFGDATNIGNVKYAGREDIVGLVSTGDGYRFVTKTLQLLKPR